MKHSQLRLIPAALVVFAWTFIPIYHIIIMAITPQSQSVAGAVFPNPPTLANFVAVLTEDSDFVRYFWIQLGNSALVGIATVAIVLALASVTSFAITRLKARGGTLVNDLALLTYVVPAAFLVVPLYEVIGRLDLMDTRVALVMTMVTFTTPYAIWILNQAGGRLPFELDEAARIDGATGLQIFRYVYLPLLAPTLMAIGTYAMMMSWNEYLYALMILATPARMTLPVGLNNFLNGDSAPWNLLMATGLIYAIPPVAIYYACRRFLVLDLTSGAVKG